MYLSESLNVAVNANDCEYDGQGHPLVLADCVTMTVVEQGQGQGQGQWEGEGEGKMAQALLLAMLCACRLIPAS